MRRVRGWIWGLGTALLFLLWVGQVGAQGPVRPATPTPVPTPTPTPERPPARDLVPPLTPAPLPTPVPPPEKQPPGPVELSEIWALRWAGPVRSWVAEVPGQAVLEYRLVNDGELPHEVEITPLVLAPPGWQVRWQGPFRTRLEPGEILVLRAAVEARIGVRADRPLEIALRARGEARWMRTAEIRTYVGVAPELALEFRLSPSTQAVPANERAAYTLWIQNQGTLSAPLSLEVLPDPEGFDFPGTFEPDLSGRWLAPGEAVTSTLWVLPRARGLLEWMREMTERFHQMTDEDRAIFRKYADPVGTTRVQVRLGNVFATGVVTTTRLPDLSSPGRKAPPRHGPGALRTLGAAWPGGNPHQKVNTTCAVCHEPHGSPMADQPGRPSRLLLASTVRALCDTCHDGTGSVYNVESGLLMAGTQPNTYGGPLNQNALPTTVGTRFVPVTYTVPGGIVDYVPLTATTENLSLGIGPAAGAHDLEARVRPPQEPGIQADWLLCTSCHDPHGNANHRYFRNPVTFGGRTISVTFVVTVTNKGTDLEAEDLVSGSLYACRACHPTKDNHGAQNPRYLTDDPATGYTWTTYQNRVQAAGLDIPLEENGADPNRYLVCLTCHRGHGSRSQPDFPLEREDFGTINATYGIWCLACHNF